ncbi:MAG TPA: UPF0158 family protein [Pyrinomonadaceae bacterium]|nr:UPF0158 family protein [Pyrinomonadaceae bacterium]
MKSEGAKPERVCKGTDSSGLGRKIDHEALVAAIETELPEVEHYLDLRSGEILTVVGPVWTDDAETVALDEIARDNRKLALLIRAEPDCYELVPSVASEAGFRWMQEFAATIASAPLREKLQKLLRDCTDDCFRLFRRALPGLPDRERERWFAFRNEKIEEFINAWLEGLGA